MKTKTHIVLPLAIVLTAALTACGGGGGGNSPTPTPAPAPAPAPLAGTSEGFWFGPASTGTQVYLAVLENGETWGFYTSGNNFAGALYGISTGTGTAFAATGTDFNFGVWRTSANTFLGTVAAKSSINATASAGTGGTVALRYDASYDTAATLATVVGNYTMSGVSALGSGTNVPISITAAGQVTSTVTGTCSAAGTIAPRPSGKNIYNIALTFTGTGCALGNGGTTSGIFILDKSVTPSVAYAIALTPAKNDGFFAVGTKR